MKRLGRVLLWIVVAVVGVLLLAGVVAAAVPLPADPPVDMAAHGAGSSSVQPAMSGLLRAFPASNEPEDNPTTPERAELGRLRFFDPTTSPVPPATTPTWASATAGPRRFPPAATRPFGTP